ncbi:putative endonuclease 4 [Paraoerskovia sediminicola]|uniref:Endonuclease 4 n=1 Tax=Paraoerskovia sediminicola TaxID=1138587 RepID=A0ABN6XA03_9CELL|nr:deoxyribonuclease IV [Paraoerskovia sediminicola]BDZ41737.1 putative endonuclease 4 [Paraoerskovia sediminicola]
MRIGAHVDQSDAVAQAREIGADVAQVFLSDPQSWKGCDVTYPGGAEALRADAAAADLELVVHAPYVINVASTNNRIRIPSRKLLQKIMDGAAQIGARGVVVHGGHVTANDDPAKGFDNWRKAIESLETDVPVLIENTAGGEHSMARRLERIEQLWAAVRSAAGGAPVGFTLDTCHAHAGGLQLSDVVARVLEITGRIDLVHANDSIGDFDSGQDRHTSFGEGTVDPADLVAVVRDAGAPVVCETHGTAPRDIAWLRERLAG